MEIERRRRTFTVNRFAIEIRRPFNCRSLLLAGIGVRLRPESPPDFRRGLTAKTEWAVDHLVFGSKCSFAARPNESQL